MGRIEAPAEGESRRQTATPRTYGHRACSRPYHQAVWPVTVLWDVLAVSRSGFYSYLERCRPARVDAEEMAL